MSEATATAESTAETKVKSFGRRGMLLGIALGLAGAGAGFFAAQSGLLGGSTAAGSVANGHGGQEDQIASTDSHSNGVADTHGEQGHDDRGPGSEKSDYTGSDLGFVALDPLLISLRGTQNVHHLRFRTQLEVFADHKKEVEALRPRIVDMMNGYLRALQPSDFEDPLVLTRIRSQLLRRLQLIAGDGRVNDVLIMEFVLN